MSADALREDFPGGTCAVVVVAYNCSRLLRQHLAPIDWFAAGTRMVVVDNSDDADERARTAQLSRAQDWIYLPQAGNGGFGAGANAGADFALRAGAASLLFLNPDAWLDEATLTELRLACELQPSTAVSPVIYRPDGREWFTGGIIDLRRGRVSGRVDLRGGTLRWLCGAALAMSGDLWRRTGGFNADYFLYWEDVELGWRVLEAGGSLRVLELSRAYHEVGATQQPGPKPASYVFYNSRNRLRFAAAHLTARQRVSWLLATPRNCWELVGMANRTPAAFWAALRGSVEGMRALVGPATHRVPAEPALPAASATRP